ALRAGRAEVARRQLEAGLAKLAADRRPRAFGEEARWHLSYGDALLALREADAAQREFRAVLAADAADWVHGRAHRDLGKLADLTGNRALALEEYRAAIRLCEASDDSVCADEAKHLTSKPYR